jgi:hypothetical protein
MDKVYIISYLDDTGTEIKYFDHRAFTSFRAASQRLLEDGHKALPLFDRHSEDETAEDACELIFEYKEENGDFLIHWNATVNELEVA